MVLRRRLLSAAIVQSYTEIPKRYISAAGVKSVPGRRYKRLLEAVFALEAFHPAFGIDIFLFPGKERMTLRTDPDFYILFRGTGLDDSSAGTDNTGFSVFGMDSFFHSKLTRFARYFMSAPH